MLVRERCADFHRFSARLAYRTPGIAARDSWPGGAVRLPRTARPGGEVKDHIAMLRGHGISGGLLVEDREMEFYGARRPAHRSA